MVPPYDEAVERLYDRLVNALERARPRPYDAPVTVAEIYQELVPYRSVRGEAGFAMNADYEHALLSLLASDLAQLEPDHARDEIRRELDSLNPNVSIYRSYAGCDVWIRRPAQRDPSGAAESRADSAGTAAAPARHSSAPAEAPPVGTRRVETSGVEESSKASSKAPADAAPQVEAPRNEPRVHATRREATDAKAAGAQGGGSQSGRAAAAASEPSRAGAPVDADRAECARCDERLPQHVRVLFCPACGAQQVSTPCAACGETVEAGWSFCVACGTETRPAARSPA